VKFNEKAEFSVVGQLTQADSVGALSWRGDLLLAASYDGRTFCCVIYGFNVVVVVLSMVSCVFVVIFGRVFFEKCFFTFIFLSK
jgi:hypothetical protein